MRPIATVILCCVMGFAEARGLEPILLHASSEKPLNVPSFSFFGKPQSDDRGDIFIHPGTYEEVNILKVTPSSETAVYKLPDALAQKYSFDNFSVTPSGVVWALVWLWAGDKRTGSAELRAIEFDSDGEAKNPVRLDLPNDVEASRFLALDSGVLFVGGNYTEKANARQRSQPFLGIFDSSGRLLKSLTANLPSSDSVKVPMGQVREGACATSEDGNAYFLGGNSVLTLTPGGDVSKRTQFKKPAPGLIAAGLRVSNGWAAIEFETPKADNTIESSFLVIELATGNVMGWYKPDEDIHGGSAAFSPNDGLTFLVYEQGGKAKLVQTKLR